MQDLDRLVPFERIANYSNQVVNAARSLGLNILGNLGDCGEINVEHAILSPPYIVNVEEMRENVTRLKAAVQLVDRVILGSKEPHEAGGERISEFRKDVANLRTIFERV